MLPFKNIIKIDSDSNLPMYVRISNAVIEQISIGALASGMRLPSTRSLSEMLAVHRKTVVAAYDELNAQGWIVSKGAAGTFISDELPILNRETEGQSFTYDAGESKNPISYKYEIDDGHPDTRLAPMESFRKAYSALFRNKHFIKQLDYNPDFKGNWHFRKELADYLRKTRGIYADKDNVLVTRGSIHAFYLVIATLFKGNKNIAAGYPGYGSIPKITKIHGGNNIKIPIDEKGISVDFIEEYCQKERLDMVFVIPHHHYPTTVTLSPERRMKLVELAKKYDFIILEDDYDYDFHYEGGPALPLSSLNHEGRVIYVGSFSKTVVPAMRMGFIVADKKILEKIALYRRFVDRNSDLILEKVMLELIKFGELSRHNKKAIRIYKKRRDIMHKAFQKEFKHIFEYKLPEGGMAFWIQLKNGINYDLIKERIKEKSIDFHMHTSNGFRVGFAAVNEVEIEERVDLLKYIFRDYL